MEVGAMIAPTFFVISIVVEMGVCLFIFEKNKVEEWFVYENYCIFAQLLKRWL